VLRRGPPILANVYLHYVNDLWVQRWRHTKASGDVIVVRYADDQIVGFEHEHEAKAFLHDLHERMRAFELALHPDKTRLIRFGRHAANWDRFIISRYRLHLFCRNSIIFVGHSFLLGSWPNT